MTVDANKCYQAIEEVVTRKIEEEFVIVPLVTGIGDLDSEMFSLNNTGAAVWKQLDGKKSLNDIIQVVAKKFDAPYDTIHSDIIELMAGLFKKGLVNVKL